MLSLQGPLDDINVGHRLPQPDEKKRARSWSPVKARRPLQDWASLSLSADGSLDRLFSTKSLTHEQLMRFSNSELSERLHISKADHAIPIPFQIQFPPRLTHSSVSLKSSGCLSSPTRLVFTGHAYEPVTPEMSLSPGFVLSPSESSSRSSVKPPSVISSRRKVSAFVQQTHVDHLHQLSMIGKKSNSGISRAPSCKVLPAVPPKDVLLQSDNETRGVQPGETAETAVLGMTGLETLDENTTTSKSKSHTMARRKPPPSDKQTLGEGHHEEPVGYAHARGEAPRTPQAEKLQKCVSNTAQTSPDKSLPRTIVHTATFQHNLCVTNMPGLDIDTRTFTQASQVSSVSSFGSLGETSNFSHAYMLSPNAKGEVRISKHVVDHMFEGNSEKWKQPDSGVQPSQSFSKHDLRHREGSPTNLRAPSKESRTESMDKNAPEPHNHNAGLEDLEVNPDLTETLLPTRSIDDISLKAESVAETAPLVILRRGMATEGSTDEDNLDDIEGAGIGFHFPNNNTNATNGSEAQKKQRAQKPKTRGSSRTSFLIDGKIEIPDLDDKLFWQKDVHNTAYRSSRSSVDAPNSADVLQLNSVQGERSGDSDSESSFNSQFSKLQTKTPEPKPLLASRSQVAVSAASSPVRNSRHRSKYSIDFNYRGIASPVPNHHSRSRSTTCVDTFAVPPASLAHSSWNPREETVPRRLNSPYKPVKSMSQKRDNLNLRVNELPARVSYAVDFKLGDAVPDAFPNFDTQRPPEEYYRGYKLSQRPRSNASVASYSLEGSETSSGYRSSKIGRDMASTASTAPTENGNVVIDLTKEKYNVHIINSNDSTTSYKSTIEKTKDGKNVEVVLVEEDDEAEDRDDLLSVYSLYMSNWGDRNRPRSRHLPIVRLTRKLSTQSEASEASDALGQSWAASSKSHFQVKSPASIRREQAYRTKLSFANLCASSDTFKEKLASGDKYLNSRHDTNYFDYSTNDAYDFQSYMSQQVQR